MAEMIRVAVRKANRRRLLADFAEAARTIERAKCFGRGGPAYALGSVEMAASLTLRASLLCAFGG